jgi:tRNA modification GTPase
MGVNFDDTICATATGPGNGAIAIIRLSGPDSLSILHAIFTPASKQKDIRKQKGQTIHYGTIQDHEKPLDEVLVSLFKAPHSYTGEDMVEISCHGSSFIQQAILHLLIRQGASAAKPGEFTQRAFLNGKMDLSQAEAVADIVASSSEVSHAIAMNQLRGGFSSAIALLRGQLLQFISLIELELDFSEEEVEFADRARLKTLISAIHKHLSSLSNSFGIGNAIKSGIPVVIAGLPNVGKSTLLNILLNEERAIVSEIPGTTRDVIEDQIHIEGYLFRFIDTAGLRHTEDKVEMIGIRKTWEKLKQASVILLIADAPETEEEILLQVEAVKPEARQKLILVLNKADQLAQGVAAKKAKLIGKKAKVPVVPISAKSRWNLDALKHQLLEQVKLERDLDSGVIVTNARHYEALLHAKEASGRVLSGLKNKITTDLIAQDIREILHYLGEITGEITNDEILGNIFANFCIGK